MFQIRKLDLKIYKDYHSSLDLVSFTSFGTVF